MNQSAILPGFLASPGTGKFREVQGTMVPGSSGVVMGEVSVTRPYFPNVPHTSLNLEMPGAWEVWEKGRAGQCCEHCRPSIERITSVKTMTPTLRRPPAQATSGFECVNVAVADRNDDGVPDFHVGAYPVIRFTVSRKGRPDAIVLLTDGRLALLSDMLEPGWSDARIVRSGTDRSAYVAEMMRILKYQQRHLQQTENRN